MRIFLWGIILIVPNTATAMITMKNHLYEPLTIRYRVENDHGYSLWKQKIEAHGKFTFSEKPKYIWIHYLDPRSAQEELYGTDELVHEKTFFHIVRNRACKAGFCLLACSESIKELRQAIARNHDLIKDDLQYKLKDAIAEEAEIVDIAESKERKNP